MFPSLPPIPAWNQLHPLVIHFPIALLIIAPAILILALAWKSQRRGLMLATLALMVFGTLGAIVAASTGEATRHAVEIVDGSSGTMRTHAHLAERARNIFIVLTLVFAGLAHAWSWWTAKFPRWTLPVATALFALVYAWGLLTLTAAAHEGGTLVHKYGVRAWNTPTQTIPDDSHSD